MSQPEMITVETTVACSPAEAWHAFTTPEAIMAWNFASPDWHCPAARVDLRVGGKHWARMEAKDGSFGFDFTATYEAVDPPHVLALRLDDGRLARTVFEPGPDGTEVTTQFDPDPEASVEMQQGGWQAILDNYKRYAEAKTPET